MKKKSPEDETIAAHQKAVAKAERRLKEAKADLERALKAAKPREK